MEVVEAHYRGKLKYFAVKASSLDHGQTRSPSEWTSHGEIWRVTGAGVPIRLR